VVVSAGPDGEIKCFYRARVFAAENKKLENALATPWIHLGPPPMVAASAGRMNAHGISVFYGAVEPMTALAEARPPVGSKVAIAKFTIERALWLLDVEALKSVTISGSIFDPDYIGRIQRANFLEILSGRISRPIMPNEEAVEYLATQAVADYMATEAKLDGIVFPSVQVGHASSNVVLFHHSSRVEEIQLPKGTEITASLEQHDSDGVYPDYHVWEDVPSTPTQATLSEANPFDLPITPVNYDYEFFDLRQPSLKIDLDSVTVYHIKAVSFNVDEYPVNRSRTVKPESSII
jgi:RES domain-containing protein